MPRPVHPLLARLAPWLLVSVVYTAASVLFLWPMPAHLGTAVWGDRFDAWTTLWLMDHLHRHIADGTLAAETNEILFPFGYNLWSFGHAALQFIGVGLMLVGVPLVPAYNLLLIGGFATSALGAHILGRSLSGDHLGGFVAGIAFATSPYLYGEGAAGCIELVAAGLIPLFAWTLIQLTRAPGRPRALAAAAALAIVGPFNWYYTLFSGMLGVGYTAWQAAVGRARIALWCAGAMALAAAVDAPLIPLVRRETPTRPPVSAELFEDADAWERKQSVSDGTWPLEDLTEAVLEEHDAMQVVENSTTVEALLRARFTLNPLQSTPGAIAFAVGILGLAVSGRRGLGWAVIGVGATILTLGPFLRVDETPPLPTWAGDWPLPYYYAYQYLPFFSKAYRPYRIGVITLTACAALGASGMAALALEVRRRWLVLGTALLGLTAYTQPFWSGDRPALRLLSDAAPPPIYTALAAQPPGGVIEVPLHYQPLTVPNARFQYNAVAHHHPTLNCNQLIRRTDLMAFRDYVLGNDFLASLIDLGRRAPPLRFSSRDLDRAAADGFRYIILHTLAEADDVRLTGNETSADLVGEPGVEMLRTVLGAPVLTGDGVEVYRMPEATSGPERLWTWTGEDVVDLPLALDARKYGLPVPLPAGSSMPIYEGHARKLSFWARPESTGDVVVRVHSADGVRDVVEPLVPRHWRWVEVPIPETGPVAISLIAQDTPSVFRITRAQVLR